MQIVSFYLCVFIACFYKLLCANSSESVIMLVDKEGGSMAVTIQKIADHAGVSRGTVDRVLNHRGRVASDVEAVVWQVVKDLGYVQKPRKKRCNFTIGVITQLADASFMQDIEKGIWKAQEELSHRNVQVIVKQSRGMDEEEQLKQIDELEASGIQALAIMPVDSTVIRTRINRLIEEKKMPVITFNSDIVGTKRQSFVGLDNKQSGKAAAGLLGTLTQGCGKVLIINGYFTNHANSLRVDGFVEEMRKSYPDVTLLGVQSSQDKSSEVERILCETLAVHPDLAGVFLASAGQDGVSLAIQKCEIKKRPYIVAYDCTTRNIDCLKRGDFDFLIDQESERQGYMAIMLLYDMLSQKIIPPEYCYTNIQLKTKYTVE